MTQRETSYVSIRQYFRNNARRHLLRAIAQLHHGHWRIAENSLVKARRNRLHADRLFATLHLPGQK